MKIGCYWQTKLNGMIKEIKDLRIDRGKLITIDALYVESRYLGAVGLTADGMPTNEQAKEFIEFAQQVKAIINTELINNFTP